MPHRQVWAGREHAGPNLVRIFVRKLRRRPGEDAAHPSFVFNQSGQIFRSPMKHFRVKSYSRAESFPTTSESPGSVRC